jgi:hypothetical protein
MKLLVAFWPNKAPAPNRRPRFPFAALFPFGYPFCAPPASPAAVGEAQRYAAKPLVGLPPGAGDGSEDRMMNGRNSVVS